MRWRKRGGIPPAAKAATSLSQGRQRSPEERGKTRKAAGGKMRPIFLQQGRGFCADGRSLGMPAHAARWCGLSDVRASCLPLVNGLIRWLPSSLLRPLGLLPAGAGGILRFSLHFCPLHLRNPYNSMPRISTQSTVWYLQVQSVCDKLLASFILNDLPLLGCAVGRPNFHLSKGIFLSA